MNKEEFLIKLKELNVNYTEEMINQLEIYKSFLIEYNKHTNLTRIVDEEEIYLKHFFDSLTIAKVIDLNKINNLIDVGTGAGFPGMVIKIFYPNIDVTLLDSNNKKTTFLNELKKKINIDVNIINDRIENYSKNNLNKFDIVTSRAVANLRVLSEISLPLVKENGYFIPLKGNIEEELKETKSTLKYFNSNIERIETFNEYGIRNILLIKKNSLSQENDIREYGKIIKKSL